MAAGGAEAPCCENAAAVAVTRPRNERPEPVEPGWCALTVHQTPADRHKSRTVRVGPEPRSRGNGQAAVWLLQQGHGPTWVCVQAAHMTSTTVEISLQDAAALRDGLTRLLERAGHQERDVSS